VLGPRPGGIVELNEAFWNQIKNQIKARNAENKSLETWLNPVSYVETLGSGTMPRIILGVPNDLSKYFVVENILEKIYCEISELYKGPFEVDVIVKKNGADAGTNDYQAYSENEYEPGRVMQGLNNMNRAKEHPYKDVLNPEYTFHTFVVGRNTEFAHAASYNVARNPGGSDGYNPLFICGPVGMGKTHLLNAVGNYLKESLSHLKIQYISAERFLNDFVAAVRTKETEKFRQKFRDGADVLLVDDVQFIGRGEATQQEFFHVINSFLDNKKQVVLASDRMPKDILNIEDRNRSRLEWGLIADISMPDLETRMAILRYKAERFGIRLNEEVISYVARLSKRSIRELEGNLKKMKMFSELQGISIIDIGLAKRVLANHETQTTISSEDIQKMVADHYKVRISDLKSTTRSKNIVVPRQVSMYLIKRHLDKSLVDIGRQFGGKDHTTVMNAIERVEHLQAKDLDFKNDLEELVTRIHNITGL
jgi:chromosomal replication initiator protein